MPIDFVKEEKLRQSKASLQQNVVLVIFGLFLCLVLLEVGLRLGGFVLLSIQEYGNLQSIKQKGAYRILCLGESTTQGQYPQPLEEVLNQRHIGVRFSVVDKGMPGINTFTILSRVESYLAEYRPNMVVTMMGINDQGRHIPFGKAAASKWMLFIRSFKIYKLIRFLELRLLTKDKKMGLYKPNEDRQSSEKTQTYLPEAGFKETSVESIPTEGSFKKTIEINPKDDDAYVKQGILFRDQGEFLQAEDSFKKAIEINPRNDTAYFKLGWLYREQAKFSQAEECLRKAVEINPDNDGAHAQLGALYKQLGRFSAVKDFRTRAIDKAEQSCKRAIALNPGNFDAFFELGELYRGQNKLSQAEDLFRIAIELNPGDERFLGAMLSLYDEMGKSGLVQAYGEKTTRPRSESYPAITASNYRKLKEILDRKGIKLVCVQYPMRNVEPLKRIFEKDKGVIFVDNESVFKEAIKKGSYKEYFRDMFGGDFGHCTEKGNKLLAQNIADMIFVEVFNKDFSKTSTTH